ncbi:MAG: hypothetical protein RSD99_06975, partial [Janthinobacterium sp.]
TTRFRPLFCTLRVLSHNRVPNAAAGVSGNDIYSPSRTHSRHPKNTSRHARCGEKMAALFCPAAPLRGMKKRRAKVPQAMPHRVCARMAAGRKNGRG